jgi:hypothetical protein
MMRSGFSIERKRILPPRETDGGRAAALIQLVVPALAVKQLGEALEGDVLDQRVRGQVVADVVLFPLDLLRHGPGDARSGLARAEPGYHGRVRLGRKDEFPLRR